MNNDRIRQLQLFLDEDPNDSFSRYALGLEFLKMNNLEDGIAQFEFLIGQQPDYLPTYYQLGKSYEAMNNREKALATYSHGIEIAKRKGERHTLSELQSAYQNLMFSDE